MQYFLFFIFCFVFLFCFVLFFCGFTSHSRIIHSFGDVEGLQILTCSILMATEQWRATRIIRLKWSSSSTSDTRAVKTCVDRNRGSNPISPHARRTIVVLHVTILKIKHHRRPWLVKMGEVLLKTLFWQVKRLQVLSDPFLTIKKITGIVTGNICTSMRFYNDEMWLFLCAV